MGPTTARVTVSRGFVTDVVLRLHGDAEARMWFWDHGALVVVHHPVRPDSSGYRRSRHPAAIGAGDDDVGGQIQLGFADVVYAAEQLRHDPTSTDRDLNDAIKALSDAQDDYAR